MEDPDQIEEAQLEKILPHDIMRVLLNIFKNNELKEEQPEEYEDDRDSQDSKVWLKQSKLADSDNKDYQKVCFKIDVTTTNNRLSLSYVAGICLMDLVKNNDWSKRVLEADFS